MITSKSDLFNTKPLTKTLCVPSWGCDVTIRPLTKREKLAIQKLIDEKDEYGNEKTVAMGLCDEKGVRILTDEDWETIASTMPELGSDQIATAIFDISINTEIEAKKGSAESPKN